MRKTISHKMIGVFWLVSLVSLLSIFFYTWYKKISNDNAYMVVMFFEESINGLNIGADVVLKGVKVGEVKKINIQINAETLDFSIPVFAIMKEKVIRTINKNSHGDINDLIKKGLRARLTTQSYLTGQLMIELEMLPNTPIKYHNVKDIVEIPTTLSAFGELSQNLQSLPIGDAIKNFSSFFANINKTMPDFDAIIKNLKQFSTVDKRAFDQLPENVNNTLYDIQNAAKSLKNLTDFLERHPEALLKGKKQ